MNNNQKIYEGQTGIQIILDCETDVSDATQYRIHYTKPDRSTGSVAATLLINTINEIYFVITNDEFLDLTGVWKFWAWVYWDADTVGTGNIDKLRVYRVGT